MEMSYQVGENGVPDDRDRILFESLVAPGGCEQPYAIRNNGQTKLVWAIRYRATVGSMRPWQPALRFVR